MPNKRIFVSESGHNLTVKNNKFKKYPVDAQPISDSLYAKLLSNIL